MSNVERSAETGKMQNPFIYNAPVRGMDFFNRDEIIKKLLHETINGRSQGNVWVTGERQVGKTSLLRYIQSKHEYSDKKIKLYPSKENFDTAFIYLNTQDTKSRDHFYRNMRQSLKDFFDFKIDEKDDAYTSFIYALSNLFFEKKYYIVFLLDEFDAFIEHLAAADPQSATLFLAEFNKLIQGVSGIKDEPKVFSCIFAANHTIEELVKENEIGRRGSGLVVENIELEWFTKKQVENLAQSYLENNPLRFSEKDIDLCFDMTLGYPYFVQKLFSIIYEEKSDIPVPEVYLPKVKNEYGKVFQETVKGWGGPTMPKRTREKLIDLSGKILKKAGDKSLDRLTDISALASLTALKELSLNNNKITNVSPLVGLKQLKTLDLRNNALSQLPVDILHADMEIKWEYKVYIEEGLYLDGNPLETPPVEVVKQGKNAILDYFKKPEKDKK